MEPLYLLSFKLAFKESSWRLRI